MSVTAELIRHGRGLTFEALLPEVVLVAKTCVLDWIACAIAGSAEPLTEILAAASPEAGSATLIGRSERRSTSAAALINGSAAHALDFDDTHLVMTGHPSAPVAPAALALAEEQGATGRAFLTAFVAGVETECRLGAVLGLGHYLAGWHSTATLGTFGSAAACSHLLGCDEDAWAHAFGIAGVQASGLKSVFGSMSKPFQVGRAAQNGLLAATLAQRGFTSSPEIIEVHQGFAETHHATLRPEVLGELRDRFLVRETVFKYHASCYLTHSGIEALLKLVDEHKFLTDYVKHVDLFVPRGHLDVCNITEPATGLEGKFSLRATAAMALLGDDTADPAAFTDARMRSRELIGLRDNVDVNVASDMAGTQTRVEVELHNGKSLSATADVGIPATDLERQWDKLTAKFVRLCSPVLGEDTAWKLHERIGSLEELDSVRDLTELCVP